MKYRNLRNLLSGFCLKTDRIKCPRQVILVPKEMCLMLTKESIFYREPKFDVFQCDNALAGPVVRGCDGALHLQEALAATECVDVWCTRG